MLQTSIEFSTFRKNYAMKRTANKRFFHYSLYAFGLPILISTLAFIIDESSFISDAYKIGMGQRSCFVNNDRVVKIIYLYLPIAVVLLLNVTFYSITAYKIFKVQKEFADIQKNDSSRHSSMNLDRTR
jgi:G protein-coupled receptor Mth (Methuselah protein)